MAWQELTNERRLDFIEKEVELLQSRFDKYDNWAVAQRTVVFTGAVGAVALAISEKNLWIMPLGQALLFFGLLSETTLRAVWMGYVGRHRYLRNALKTGEPPLSEIVPFDFTNSVVNEQSGAPKARGVSVPGLRELYETQPYKETVSFYLYAVGFLSLMSAVFAFVLAR